MIGAVLLAAQFVVDVPRCPAVPAEFVGHGEQLLETWGLQAASGLASWGNTLGVWEKRNSQEVTLVLVTQGQKKQDEFVLRPPRGQQFEELYHLAFWGKRAELVVAGGPPFFVFVNASPAANFAEPAHLVFPGNDVLLWLPLEGGPGKGFPVKDLLVKSDLKLTFFEALREAEEDANWEGLGTKASNGHLRITLEEKEELEKRRAKRLAISFTGAMREDGKLWLLQSYGKEGELVDDTGKTLRKFTFLVKNQISRPDLEAEKERRRQELEAKVRGQAQLQHFGDATRRPPGYFQVRALPTPPRTARKLVSKGKELLVLLTEEAVGVPGVVLWIDERAETMRCFTLPTSLSNPKFFAATHDTLWFAEPLRYLTWQAVNEVLENEKRPQPKPGGANTSLAPAK